MTDYPMPTAKTEFGIRIVTAHGDTEIVEGGNLPKPNSMALDLIRSVSGGTVTVLSRTVTYGPWTEISE